jgi:hypothetical protein
MLINKYSKLYYNITANAKQRIVEGYTELHHIIPQSMGGNNEKENLVELTAREHFICHWLLVKMTEGDDRSKMLYALKGMKAENKFQQRYQTKITARVYETYRIEHAENHSKTMKGRPASNKGRPMPEEQKQLLREKAKANHANGKVYSKESQEKRVAKILGQKRTDETKRLMSLASKGKPKGPMSEEEKLKRSITMTGQKKVKTHGANVANAVLGNISINKDNTEKKVKKDTLQSYLDDGWQLGGKKRKVA